MFKELCKEDIYVYRCSVCKQVVISFKKLENPVRCCERDMELLVPGSVDASIEHHVPQYKQCGCYIKIKVGSTLHPMTKEHHIEWIALVTNRGIHFKHLKETDHPCASFHLDSDEEVCCIYTFCNLHGLWKASEE
ncbi:MAG: desulfoferrodoxin [Lachnospiraceae bacterium]|nr:desulfoferrodoxin [Lachnospiraceae bacterium]